MSEKRKPSTSTRKRGSKASPSSKSSTAKAAASKKTADTAAQAAAAESEVETSTPTASAKASAPDDVAGATSDIYGYADLLQADQEAAEDEERRQEREESWVSFRLAEQNCALPVDQVQEVLRVGSITRVPHAPSAVRGVTNLRGRVLPVVDLRRRLGLRETELDEHSRVLVAAFKNRPVGMLVDGVHQMVAILPSTIQDTPEEAVQLQDEVVHGVCSTQDRGLLLLLDLQRLLTLSTETADLGTH